MDVFALLRTSREELLRNAATLEMAHTCRNNGGGGIGGGGARPDPARRFGSNTAVPAPVLAFEGRGPFQPTTSGGTLVALGAPHPAASAARYHGLPPSSAAAASPFVGGGGGGERNAFRPGHSSVTARYAAVATTATARGGHRAERSVTGSSRAPISRQLLRAICGHLNDLSLSDTAAAVDAVDRRSAYRRSPPPARALGDWEADETHPEWRRWAGGRTARSEGESPLAAVEDAGQLSSTQPIEGKWARNDRWPSGGSHTYKAPDDGDGDPTYAVMQAYGAYRLATWAMAHRHQPDASPAREAPAATKPAWSMTQRQVNVHSEFRVHGSLKLTRRWASCEEFSVICDPDVEPPRAPASTTGGSDDGVDDTARPGAGRKRRAAPDAAGPPVQVELKDLFGPRYLFIEANSGDFSPYVLILPLMARMLAVSCPGMNCIVHFPPDVTRSGGGSARTLAKVYPNALRENAPAPGEEKEEEQKRVPTADAAAATKAERDLSSASSDAAGDSRVASNASAANQALTQFKARTSAYYQCGWESLTLPMARVPYAGPDTERLSLLRVHADSWRVCSTHRGVLFEGNRRASKTQMPPRHLPANVLNSLLMVVLQQQNVRQEMLPLKQAEEEEEREGITTDAPSLCTRTAPADNDAGPEETTLLVRYDNGSSVDVVTTRDPVSYAVRKCRRLGDIPTVVFCVNQKVGSERLVMQDRRWLRRHFAKCARLSSPSATATATATATTAAPDTSGYGACACVKGTLAEENVFVVDIGHSVRGGTAAATGPHQQRNIATAPQLGGVGRAAATRTSLRSARPGETMAWPSRISGLSRPPFMGAAMSSSAGRVMSPPSTRPSQEAGGGQRADRSSAPTSAARRPDHAEQREALEALCSMRRGQ